MGKICQHAKHVPRHGGQRGREVGWVLLDMLSCGVSGGRTIELIGGNRIKFGSINIDQGI